MENAIRSLYAARLRGDLDKVMVDIADDATFGVNARGTGVPALATTSKGKGTVKSVVKELIDAWRFDDWKEVSLLVDGDKAMIHWTARATFVPTGKSDKFDVVDVFTFRDGKIVDLRQNTDTALIMSLVV
jgi:ketosteroid isomerase-like protein